MFADGAAADVVVDAGDENLTYARNSARTGAGEQARARCGTNEARI